MNPGMIGGIIGGVIGLAGGIVGSYFSIRNTDGPKERAFMIKATVVFWFLGIIFVALLLLIKSPYKWLLWLPYSLILPLSIRYVNNKIIQIKKEEDKRQ